MIGTTIWSVLLVALLPVPRPALPKTPQEMVVRLTVDPAPAPKPALRYRLLPGLKEMSPGNPIPAYLRVLLDQDNAADVPTLGRAALREADRAARLDKPDWQILLRAKSDGIGLLLPDLQKMRELASALQGRFRDEIAVRRFDDGIYTAQTMFALARHTGEHPTLIGNLVGIAIAHVTIAPLEEMLDQPGCPNLYWALTNLPYPLVSLESGIEGERVLIYAEMKDLSDSAPMTPEQLRKAVAYVDYLRKFEPDRNPLSTRTWLDIRAKDEKYLAAARARLVEAGLKEDLVAKFPPEQVVLLDERREYEVRRDDEMKYLRLPTWEVEAARAQPKPTREPCLFEFLLPNTTRVRWAQGRLEQRICMLRVVEALRLYAADRGGELPKALNDVSVPLPLDPFSGKPFRYELVDGVAHIRGTPPQGAPTNIGAFRLHYEITIRK